MYYWRLIIVSMSGFVVYLSSLLINKNGYTGCSDNIVGVFNLTVSLFRIALGGFTVVRFSVGSSALIVAQEFEHSSERSCILASFPLLVVLTSQEGVV